MWCTVYTLTCNLTHNLITHTHISIDYRVSSLMKQQQYWRNWRLFIAQDAEKDHLYNYSHLYLQQHVYHSITGIRPVLISIDHRSGAEVDNRTGGGSSQYRGFYNKYQSHLLINRATQNERRGLYTLVSVLKKVHIKLTRTSESLKVSNCDRLLSP